MSEFTDFIGLIAGILSAIIASIITAGLMHHFELERDKQRRRLKILGWLRWLEFYLDEVESGKLFEVKKGKTFDKDVIKNKLHWWADHAMQNCGDSLGLLSENERKEFIGLLKDTFDWGGLIHPKLAGSIAGPIHEKTKRLLDDLEKKWKETVKEDSTETG